MMHGEALRRRRAEWGRRLRAWRRGLVLGLLLGYALGGRPLLPPPPWLNLPRVVR